MFTRSFARSSRLFDNIRPLSCLASTEASLELGQQIKYVPYEGEPELVLERAKSGNSKCKACGVNIPKKEFRLSSSFAWQSGFLHLSCFGRTIGNTALQGWDPLEWHGLQFAMAESMPQYARYHDEARAIRASNAVAVQEQEQEVRGTPGYDTHKRAHVRRGNAVHSSYRKDKEELSRLLSERFLSGSGDSYGESFQVIVGRSAGKFGVASALESENGTATSSGTITFRTPAICSLNTGKNGYMWLR